MPTETRTISEQANALQMMSAATLPADIIGAFTADQAALDARGVPRNAAVGILSEPSPDSVAAQIKLGLDLAEVNANGGRTLSMPTVVVVDAAGAVWWIDVHPNYTGRSEVADILVAVHAVS